MSRSARESRATSGSRATREARRPLRRSAPLFAALGDETRLRLVERLCGEGPLSITQLAGGARVSRQAITKHLDVLAEAGLVSAAREGREKVYELAPARLAEAQRLLATINAQWDGALQRLRRFVEE